MLHHRGRRRPARALLMVSMLLAPMAAGADALITMTAARDFPQATLLADGSVLVVGGNGPDMALDSAERFDPKSGTFTALPAMDTARDDSERALRLPNGKVLVTSGTADPEAELFDPATHRFTNAGNMARGRGGDTETLLPDGRVLLAGGWNGDGRWETAEIFDPAANTFTLTGSMSLGRYRHRAVRLPDGRAAVLGGSGPGNVTLASVEIYDPKTGAFTFAGEMAEPRSDLHAMPLADGRILIVGGYYFGDEGGVWNQKGGEIFDPATGKSTVIDALQNLPQDPVVVALPDGRVLVAGGFVPGDPVTAASFSRGTMLFDPATGKTSPAAPLNLGRAGATGVLLADGRVLIVGGDAWNSALNSDALTATAEIYTP